MTHPDVWHIFPPKKKIVTNARAISEAVTRSVSDCAPLFLVTVSFFWQKGEFRARIYEWLCARIYEWLCAINFFMNDCAQLILRIYKWLCAIYEWLCAINFFYVRANVCFYNKAHWQSAFNAGIQTWQCQLQSQRLWFVWILCTCKHPLLQQGEFNARI